MRTLAAERTFWEKVTLLHAEHPRPADKPIPSRLPRHYYDVVRLYQNPVGQKALLRPDLLASVVEHKMLFFYSGWANYHSARLGSIRLLPAPERLAELKRDYHAMAEMIFGDPPPFDELLTLLGEVERRLND